MQDAIIIQQASGWCLPLIKKTMAHHAAYAKRHSMDYELHLGEKQPKGWNPIWSKIVVCLEELRREREILFWLDADTVIADPSVDLRESLVLEKEMIGLVRHPGPPIHLNFGVIMIRNGPTVTKLFEEMMRVGPDGHPWHDQSVFLTLIKKPEYESLPVVIDDKWNAVAKHHNCANPVIKAWHGDKRKNRSAGITRTLKGIKINP